MMNGRYEDFQTEKSSEAFKFLKEIWPKMDRNAKRMKNRENDDRKVGTGE
jgi:hypothetical protein